MKLSYIVKIESLFTGKSGVVQIDMDPNPDGMMEKFYQAVEDCLRQIIGEKSKHTDIGKIKN